MSRQWKPGDVARVTWNGACGADRAKGHVSMRSTVAVRAARGWGWGHMSYLPDAALDDPDLKASVTPLVVIDPEDREQVERLTGALAIHGANPNDRNYWRETQAALRSLLTPPKPDEPTGLGAVVEDESGDHWVRTRTAGRPGLLGVEWGNARTTAHARWSTIAVVHVLSEGVAP